MRFDSSPATPRVSRRTALGAGLAAIGLPLLFGACGRAETDPNTLRIAWWGGEARTAKMNRILDIWQERSGVTMRREFAEYSAYWERFATQVAARNLPDLVSVTEQQVGEYASNLEDLRPRVDAGALDLSTWEPKYVEAGVVDGRLVQLFLGGTVPCLGYNRDALASFGLDGDARQWTWAQFSDACVAVSNAGAGDVWGSNDGGGSSPLFDTFLHQRGKGHFVDGALGWEPADLEEWLTRWQELREAGGVPPFDVTSQYQGAPFEDSQLARGEVVFQAANHNHVPIIQNYVDGALDYAMLPIDDAGEPAALVIGTYVAVSAASAGKVNAVAYLDFFVNDPEIITLFQADYGGLPSSVANEILAPSLEPATRASLDFYVEVEAISAIAPNWPPGGLQVLTLVQQANEAVALGETPAAAAQSCHAQARSAIGA